MKQSLKRREFLIRGSQAGIACCAFIMGANRFTFAGNLPFKKDDPIDPKALNYCGYQCPADCTFLQASLKNDTELKKKAYEQWKIKEKYNIDFDADKIYCFGCKNKDKSAGIVLKNCTVRQCAIAKGIDCCVECKELAECNKELWNQFPDFKKQVIEMQKKYLSEDAALGSILLT